MLFFDKRPARPEAPWTSRLWVYDLRTGQHFTLKQNPLRREHLDDFVRCYRPGESRDARIETERFKPFAYDELAARDKANLDITWLKDPSLEDADSLLPPEVIAQEIVDDPRSRTQRVRRRRRESLQRQRRPLAPPSSPGLLRSLPASNPSSRMCPMRARTDNCEPRACSLKKMRKRRY